jgi:hypothetical protein
MFPGFGCSSDLVASIVAELEKRMLSMGEVRQTQLQDNNAERVAIINEKLDLIVQHMLDMAPTSSTISDR